jgi:hypothetical protein
MNDTIVRDKKVLFVREYCITEEICFGTNDILTFIYNLRDKALENINERLAIARGAVKHSRVVVTAKIFFYGWYIKVTNELPKICNTMADYVLDSPELQFAVVFDKSDNGLINPRIHVCTPTEIPMKRIIFDGKFGIVESSYPDGFEFVDTDSELMIIFDEHSHKMFKYDDLYWVTIKNPKEKWFFDGKFVPDNKVESVTELIEKLNTEIIRCRSCGKYFIFRDKEREWYDDRGFKYPRRCKTCSDINKHVNY